MPFLILLLSGAFAAAAAAALGAPVPLQAGVFVTVSALTVAAARPALRRHLSRSNGVGVGTEQMQGASAVVVEHVDADQGMVRIDGELWQARALEGFGTYSPGERVRIVDISEGAALVWREELPGITDHRL
jgi:membrane protein implicated in regulation of membrane protease activity